MTLSELTNDLRCSDEEKALLWVFLTAFRAARLNVKPCSSFLAVAAANDRAAPRTGGDMKASELIEDLRRPGIVSSLSAFAAATMLARYLALADELEDMSKCGVAADGPKTILDYCVDRLREIAEGN